MAEPHVDVATALRGSSVFRSTSFFPISRLTRIFLENLRNIRWDRLGGAADRFLPTFFGSRRRLYWGEDNTGRDEVDVLRYFLWKSILVCAYVHISCLDVIVGAERGLKQRLQLPGSCRKVEPSFALGGGDGASWNTRVDEPGLDSRYRLLARSEQVNYLISRVVIAVICRVWVRSMLNMAR